MIKFNRDLRQFDASQFFLGLSIIMFTWQTPMIGGAILLTLAVLYWGMYKLFAKYINSGDYNG